MKAMMPALEQVVPEPGDSAPEWFQWALSRKAESCFVEANGNRLHYFAWNMRDVGKPLLLFVHGFLAHARWWDFIAPYFMETHRVIAMDLSGMGESGWREAYSAPQLAHDVTSLIEALGLGPATAIAHSYGGLCARLPNGLSCSIESS
jgi:pimeloyl-ACP methyl ester carboxylesterase